MKKTRFALIGGGWRAEFFARICGQLPNKFEITSTLLRSEEKGRAWEEKFHIPYDLDMDEVLAKKPDFLVLSITKPATEKLIELMGLGTPILCETPPAVTHEALLRVYEAYKKSGARVQVAEQYGFQPLYAAWHEVVKRGLIGEVSNVSLSAVHSYHAASLIRSFLDVGFQNAVLTGKRHYFNVRRTDSREGIVLKGETLNTRRDRLTFEFDNGKTGFFDFSPVQYESFIRTRHLNIQGETGEIDDLTLRRLTACGEPLESSLHRLDQGVYNNRHWSHYGIALDGEYVYHSPFPYARLNDDEIAVAQCLKNMGEWVRGEDAQVYTLEDALQDAYMALLMEEALNNPNRPIQSARQPWAGENI